MAKGYAFDLRSVRARCTDQPPADLAVPSNQWSGSAVKPMRARCPEGRTVSSTATRDGSDSRRLGSGDERQVATITTPGPV